jgi:hypothetical protein
MAESSHRPDLRVRQRADDRPGSLEPGAARGRVLVVGLRSAVPLVAAAALMAAAFAAAANAGCADPGRIERTGDSYQLVGGCVAPGDIVVPGNTPAQPTASLSGPAKG